MGLLLLSGGTAASVAMPKEAAAPTLPSYTVTLTAYNAVPEQTDGNPLETASGAYSNPEVIAARSQDLAAELPFGTIIELDATTDDTCGYSVVSKKIGYRVIEDTMNARFVKRVDILLDARPVYPTLDKGMKNAAQVLGLCKGTTIRVVGYVDIDHIPATQKELALLVAGNGALALK